MQDRKTVKEWNSPYKAYTSVTVVFPIYQKQRYLITYMDYERKKKL